jgi:two-component system, OmpR family, sensor histidine kinase KdpD
VSVSGLAARARRRAGEAEQQRREAAFAAEVSTLLLERPAVEAQLGEIAVRAADLLGVSHCWIELGTPRAPDPDEEAHELAAGGRHLGRLFVDSGSRAEPAVIRRVLTVLSSLLATAIEREDLARSDTAKTAVLRSVSHDLRSPLTAISTASEMLAGRDDSLSEADREELLESIRLQARRLDRLVENLLDLSRLEAGAAKPVLELWTVDGLVARALEAIGPERDRVAVVLPADPPAVRVDAAQLERALVNLLENALAYSSASDPVEIQVSCENGEVVVRVTDRGPGIALREQAAIFEAFRQGVRGGERGSGLGLAIARGFVQVNDGRLWVESEPGRGASFALALPAVEVAMQVS